MEAVVNLLPIAFKVLFNESQEEGGGGGIADAQTGSVHEQSVRPSMKSKINSVSDKEKGMMKSRSFRPPSTAQGQTVDDSSESDNINNPEELADEEIDILE